MDQSLQWAISNANRRCLPAMVNERTISERWTTRIAEPGETRTHVIPQPSTGSPPPEAVPMTTPQTSTPESTPAPATPDE
jgi:hypothetical protein